jgi:hypothetical protein
MTKFCITHLVEHLISFDIVIVDGCVCTNLRGSSGAMQAIRDWVDDKVESCKVAVTTDIIYSTSSGWRNHYYVEFDNDVDALMFKLKWL